VIELARERLRAQLDKTHNALQLQPNVESPVRMRCAWYQ
jgi:hypothetical protein